MSTEPRPATRDYKDIVTDPTRWQRFVPRKDDIVVCTPPKSGTTWLQGILALLISGDPAVDAKPTANAPWVDHQGVGIDEVIAKLDAQVHRRNVKTHTPFDGIPIWPQVRYIAVYRHPIDVHFSFRKHVQNQKKSPLGHLFPQDPSASFRLFLEGDHVDGASLKHILDHYRSSLALSSEELLRLHYADMLRDLPGSIEQIADHIGIAHPPAVMSALVEAATFANMKANAGRFALSPGKGFWHDDASFFDSASSNKWEGQLAEEDVAVYDSIVSLALAPEERAWLEWGNSVSTNG